jgi:hypothetical protein
MGELIELSYRHFSRLIIQKLIRAAYLRSSERHKPEAVQRAWNRFREHASRLVRDGDEAS